MNQGPFVHSKNDCFHVVGEDISSVVLGRQAGVIWSHLHLKLTQKGDRGEQGHLKKDAEHGDVASAGCLKVPNLLLYCLN